MQASQTFTATADAGCCALLHLSDDPQKGRAARERCLVVPNLPGRARHLDPYLARSRRRRQ